mgnify:CR=1 FL=1
MSVSKLLRAIFPSKIRSKEIITLSSPIIMGMLSINIIGVVDTMMIGVLGDRSLAAVGFGSFLFWCLIAILTGLGAANQTLTARYLGENKLNQLGLPLTSSLLIVTPVAICFTLLCLTFSPNILSLFSKDSLTIQVGINYFNWRVLGLVAVGWSICFRGFWNGVKEPKVYLMILLSAHAFNIFLNWILIYGNLGFPELSEVGAGIASSVSMTSAMIIYTIITWYGITYGRGNIVSIG